MCVRTMPHLFLRELLKFWTEIIHDQQIEPEATFGQAIQPNNLQEQKSTTLQQYNII